MGEPDSMALVREGEEVLGRAGCETPRLDAELLVAHLLGTDRSGVVRAGGEPLAPELAGEARRLFGRRADGEPVALVTGRKWFRGLEFVVDGSVLIPRPETELLVEWGLGLAPGARVADIGTGSGAIAVALAHERPDLDIVATDLDAGALQVAALNADRAAVEIAFAAGDLLDAVTGELDAVISNPPYIPADEVADLQREVRDHEPMIALTPGPSGLEAIERLVEQSAEREVERIALEVGMGQAEQVARLIGELGWERVEVRDDLAGIGRVVCGAVRPARS